MVTPSSGNGLPCQRSHRCDCRDERQDGTESCRGVRPIGASGEPCATIRTYLSFFANVVAALRASHRSPLSGRTYKAIYGRSVKILDWRVDKLYLSQLNDCQHGRFWLARTRVGWNAFFLLSALNNSAYDCRAIRISLARQSRMYRSTTLGTLPAGWLALLLRIYATPEEIGRDMNDDLDDLAHAAADALVSAMATDSWEAVKRRFVGLVGHARRMDQRGSS